MLEPPGSRGCIPRRSTTETLGPAAISVKQRPPFPQRNRRAFAFRLDPRISKDQLSLDAFPTPPCGAARGASDTSATISIGYAAISCEFISHGRGFEGRNGPLASGDRRRRVRHRVRLLRHGRRAGPVTTLTPIGSPRQGPPATPRAASTPPRPLQMTEGAGLNPHMADRPHSPQPYGLLPARLSAIGDRLPRAGLPLIGDRVVLWGGACGSAMSDCSCRFPAWVFPGNRIRNAGDPNGSHLAE